MYRIKSYDILIYYLSVFEAILLSTAGIRKQLLMHLGVEEKYRPTMQF